MTRIATSDGVAYEVHDRGRGRVTILLHGFASSSRTWTGVLDSFEVDRRLLAIDLLGHGGSDDPAPGRHQLERQASDIAWLVDQAADVPVDVIGYSFGARVALQLALDTPGVVRRLVLESPSAGITDPAARESRVTSDERWATLLDTGDMQAFHDAWEAQPVFASRSALSIGIRGAIRDEHLAASGRGLAASLRGAGQGAMRPLHDRLVALRIPVLVLAGGLDPAGRGRAVEIVERLSDARLEVVPGAGHAPHLECPGTFLRLIDDFLASPTQGDT